MNNMTDIFVEVQALNLDGVKQNLLDFVETQAKIDIDDSVDKADKSAKSAENYAGAAAQSAIVANDCASQASVSLGNYYTKSQIDALLATCGNYKGVYDHTKSYSVGDTFIFRTKYNEDNNIDWWSFYIVKGNVEAISASDWANIEQSDIINWWEPVAFSGYDQKVQWIATNNDLPAAYPTKVHTECGESGEDAPFLTGKENHLPNVAVLGMNNQPTINTQTGVINANAGITAPTMVAGDISHNVATTAFVASAVSAALGNVETLLSEV